MSRITLARKALNAAIQCSYHTKDDSHIDDIYNDAIQLEIELIYNALEDGMKPEHKSRALETIKKLITVGRRYTFGSMAIKAVA